jgi:hypothetical protein
MFSPALLVFQDGFPVKGEKKQTIIFSQTTMEKPVKMPESQLCYVHMHTLDLWLP